MTDPAILADLLDGVGLDRGLAGRALIAGPAHVLPSSFRLAEAAAGSIAGAALAASEVLRRRTGRAAAVTLDTRHAAVEFASEGHLRVDGAPMGEAWDALAGAYRCRDGGVVRIHTNFPHHRDGFLRLLGADYDRASVTRAFEAWDASAFDEAAAATGLPCSRMRNFAEWDAHPQSTAVASLPLVHIRRTGDAPPEGFRGEARRPLSGVRVLDLTRIVAGPVAGRTLAAHGADVLLISGPHLPSIPTLVADTGRGKRSAALDLRDEAGRDTLRDLIRGADVFLQAYRPGALAARGFGPEDLAALRPGIVCVSLSAYGSAGPWSGRRGFDSLTQTATGFNHAEGVAAGTSGEPKPFPVQGLDHGSGYLLALGAMAALLRRAEEGGSWHVEVSLARTAHWIRGLGRVEEGFAVPKPDPAPYLETTDSGFGRLTAVRHAATLDGIPAGWDRHAVPLGTHPARWDA
ncbi:CoA transferase [Roseomonas sp. CCTCC AB2023176]|uniref:CoA transferase n=1 Tax=Roseomonas sp. CCTCC AB2023176 TaxID=3342640 RepID=UPI0035DA6430